MEANPVAQSLQVDSEVKPKDSVCCVGVGTPSRRQVLEEQKFHLKHEESCWNLEVEIGKKVAKEHARAAIAEQSLHS